ncbi:DUF4412 domain-containing protein [bacterium]|nr:DUF4412 domain-containing protein [bacterium]
MKISRFASFFLFLSAAFVLLPCSIAFADVVVTIETTENDSSKTVGKMYVKKNSLRMAQGEGAGSSSEVMIYEGDAEKLITVNEKQKEYIEITQADMKKLASKMNDAMKQLEEQMANVPPQQRAMMEQMMAGMMGKVKQPKAPAPAKVRKTGDSATISGYHCDKYEVTREGKKTREYWVTSAGALTGGEELRSAFTSLGSFFEEMMSAVSDGPLAQMGSNPYAEFSQITGVPIKTIQYRNGAVVQQTVIKEIANKEIEAAMFRAPEGYARKSITDQLG